MTGNRGWMIFKKEILVIYISLMNSFLLNHLIFVLSMEFPFRSLIWWLSSERTLFPKLLFDKLFLLMELIFHLVRLGKVRRVVFKIQILSFFGFLIFSLKRLAKHKRIVWIYCLFLECLFFLLFYIGFR